MQLWNLTIFLIPKVIIRESCCWGIQHTGNNAKRNFMDFPVGSVVKNPPANAAGTGLIPGLGRFHMPRDN